MQPRSKCSHVDIGVREDARLRRLNNIPPEHIPLEYVRWLTAGGGPAMSQRNDQAQSMQLPQCAISLFSSWMRWHALEHSRRHVLAYVLPNVVVLVAGAHP